MVALPEQEQHGRDAHPAAPAPVPAAGSPPSPLDGRREVRFTVSTFVALAGVFGGYVAWTSTGSRLVLFLGLGGGIVVLVDLVVAMAVTRRVEVEAHPVIAETVVGDRIGFEVRASGPRLPVRVGLAPPAGLSSTGVALVVADLPATGSLEVGADHRCVVREVAVQVDSRGLCGFILVIRRWPAPFPTPVAVGPRPELPPEPLPEPPPGWGEEALRPSVVGDVVRGVRDYVPGDPLRQVHWRASARRGELVVKEVDEPVGTELVLVVDLGAGGVPGELAARWAAWYGREALARGYRLVLVTAVRGATVAEVAPSVAELNVRLAEAQPGPVILGEGLGHGSPTLVVSARGPQWR